MSLLPLCSAISDTNGLACFSSGSYLLRVIDFYGKLVGVPIAPGDDKKAIYTLLPEQAQRLGVALQGSRLSRLTVLRDPLCP